MAATLKVRAAVALTGGGAGAIDKIGGALLVDKEPLIAVLQASGLHPYWVDAAIGGAEASPYKIEPDSGAGNKRWMLTGFVGTFVTITVASGDPILKFAINTVDKWFIGVDDDDSDKLKISDQSDLSAPAMSFLGTDAYLEGGGASLPVWTDANKILVNLSTAQTRNALGLGTGDSPIFVTVKCSALTNGFFPYHVSDAAGLANGPLHTDGTDVFLDGALDLNQESIRLDPTPTGDHTWNGQMIPAGTAGENLVFPNLCYRKADGKWWKTDADAEATTKGDLAIAGETINADATGIFILPGSFVRDDTWAFTAEEDLYVGLAGGDIVDESNRPAGAGDVLRIVGHAKSTNIIHFCPSCDYFELL